MQRDGKCDDGSTGEEDQVFCDLGTDCSDCGPWTFSVPSQQANQTLPIKLLHSRQVSALCVVPFLSRREAAVGRSAPYVVTCPLSCIVPKRQIIALCLQLSLSINCCGRQGSALCVVLSPFQKSCNTSRSVTLCNLGVHVLCCPMRSHARYSCCWADCLLWCSYTTQLM